MRFRSCFQTWLSASLLAALASLFASAAGANVLINVDKTTQSMTVSVDGAARYRFTVSTGRPGLGTPSGTFHPERMEPVWFSKEYYNSPMPHSIFFHGGFAIHGSYEIDALGGPASHGCIRLHPDNAATLYALVEREGLGATTIVVSGETPARAMASRAPQADQGVYQGYQGYQGGFYQQPRYQPDTLFPPLFPGYQPANGRRNF
jgi:L,D-transpeptidase catalytic domain